MNVATALESVTIVGLVASAGAMVYAWRQAWLRQQARDRLGFPPAAESHTDRVLVDRPTFAPAYVRPFVRNRWWWPWLAGLALTVGLRLVRIFGLLLGLPLIFSVTFGIMAGFVFSLIESVRVARLTQKIERQLSDAIDLMVGALQAGASVPVALESAIRESKAPLKPQLEEVLGRLRLGDDPLAVFRALSQRVPLENFRLFATSLAVHWEVGGSLAPTLSTVGRSIRDRIEVSRRIRSLTMQTRVSTIAVLGATYFIGLVMWRNDPDRMMKFLSSSAGQSLVAGAMILQIIGVAWAAKIGKVRY